MSLHCTGHSKLRIVALSRSKTIHGQSRYWKFWTLDSTLHCDNHIGNMPFSAPVLCHSLSFNPHSWFCLQCRNPVQRVSIYIIYVYNRHPAGWNHFHCWFRLTEARRSVSILYLPYQCKSLALTLKQQAGLYGALVQVWWIVFRCPWPAVPLATAPPFWDPGWKGRMERNQYRGVTPLTVQWHTGQCPNSVVSTCTLIHTTDLERGRERERERKKDRETERTRAAQNGAKQLKYLSIWAHRF